MNLAHASPAPRPAVERWLQPGNAYRTARRRTQGKRHAPASAQGRDYEERGHSVYPDRVLGGIPDGAHGAPSTGQNVGTMVQRTVR